MVTSSRSPGRRRPGPASTSVTKTDDEPTSFTLVGNEVDRIQRREHRAAPTISCALRVNR